MNEKRLGQQWESKGGNLAAAVVEVPSTSRHRVALLGSTVMCWRCNVEVFSDHLARRSAVLMFSTGALLACMLDSDLVSHICTGASMPPAAFEPHCTTVTSAMCGGCNSYYLS